MLRSIRCVLRRWLLYAVVLFFISTLFLYVLIERSGDYQTSTESLSSLRTFCELNNETQRAIDRASSNFCKEKLKEVSCEILANDTFFPRSLPRFCEVKSKN